MAIGFPIILAGAMDREYRIRSQKPESAKKTVATGPVATEREQPVPQTCCITEDLRK